MKRFFRGPVAVMDGIRDQLIIMLDQPNGRAFEPWCAGGDFIDDGWAYVALGDHHTTGEFESFVGQFIEIPELEEINEAVYRAAMPKPEWTL